ncbi:hypothetical protein AA0323_1645 [Asaia siamensis NRIC 0323]|nr:hypothetical protein AA0323_1645 [Asaia siamensis NRIC 0323]
MLRQQQQVLSQQSDGDSENWASTHSKATAVITASNTRTETKQVSLLRQASVAAPTRLVSIGKRYSVKKTAAVHSAPEAGASVTETLHNGNKIWVTGSVQDGNWYLVSRGGQAIGYVPSTLLTRVVTAAPKAQAVGQVVQSANDNAPINLDDLEPVDKVATANAVPTVVTASVTCRDLRTVANGGAQSATTNSNACLSPQGVWEVN